MKAVRRTTLVGEVERELRQALLGGRFGPTLPGLRVLARVLGVSAPTVAQALETLAGEGLVRSAGPRRRMEIAAPAAVMMPVTRQERVLWFASSEGFDHAAHGITEMMSFLQQLLADSDWQVRHRVLAYGYSENRSAQWDGMMEAERPEAMVVWSGRPPLGAWAVERGLRTLFLGGAVEGADIPLYGVRSVDMIHHALECLIAMGHRRIFMPLCNRPPQFVKKIRQAVAAPLRRLGVEGAVRDWVPDSAYEGGAVIEAMVMEALRKRSPTGWIFFDWRECLAATCVFRDLGLEIPRHVSVIVLSQDPAMSWFRPTLAHFRQPLEALAKASVAWLKGESPPGTRYFMADWNPGESVGPVTSG
jgi:DNA-binding LacI/PurR family transcriptional regulator